MFCIAILAASFNAMIGISLFFADRIHKRMLEDEQRLIPTQAAVAEKRRILERDRSEWVETLHTSNKERLAAATRNIKEIDAKLIALADEEARVVVEEAP